MKTIALVTNLLKDKELFYTKKVVDLLREKCILTSFTDLEIDDIKLVSKEEFFKTADVVLVLGGDGTIIRTSKLASIYKKPILGINLGTLGFLAEVEKQSLGESLLKVVEGDFETEERFMIDAKVIRGGREITCFTALNDFVVCCPTQRKVVNTEVRVSGEVVDIYTSDGLILATPTGSTAYSLSAGGPIVDSTMEIIIINPICPHSLYARPIIVPKNKEIEVFIRERKNTKMCLTVDGRNEFSLLPDDIVKVTKSHCATTLVKINGTNFYEILRKKFSEKGWEQQ